jgi:hypothetical protein
VNIACSPHRRFGSRETVWVFRLDGWARGVIVGRRGEWEILADGLNEVAGSLAAAKRRMEEYLSEKFRGEEPTA